MTTVPLDAYTMADMASEKDRTAEDGGGGESASSPSAAAAAAAAAAAGENVAAYASAAAWVGKMPQLVTSEGESAGPIGGRTAKKLRNACSGVGMGWDGMGWNV